MRNTLFFLFFLSSFCFSFKSGAELQRTPLLAEPGGTPVLFKVTPRDAGAPAPGVTIRLYKDSVFIKEGTTQKPDGWMPDPISVVFSLERQSHYRIALSKPGYITLVMRVDTHLPGNVSPDTPFQTEVDVKMMLEAAHPELKDPDFPLVNLIYNSEKGKFMPDKEYAKSIHIMMQM